MTYLGGSLPASWELEEERFLSSTLSQLSDRRRMAILLTAGMVTAIGSYRFVDAGYEFWGLRSMVRKWTARIAGNVADRWAYKKLYVRIPSGYSGPRLG